MIYTDPTGHNIWVEGPNPNEPPGHQSICVGNPNGNYSSYSFGFNEKVEIAVGGVITLQGEVYNDVQPGGKIVQDKYLDTTTEEDAQVKNDLDGKLGKTAPYTPANTCRTFSQGEFDNIANTEIGQPGTPPNRNTQGFPSDTPKGIFSSITSYENSKKEGYKGEASTNFGRGYGQGAEDSNF